MNSVQAVSFIICTYNRASYLDETLESLLKHDSTDFDYEILVVNNNSEDETEKILAKYRQQAEQLNQPLRSCLETRQGLSFARNRGVQEARAKHVVFFDDDIMATQSLITAWCTFFEEHPEAEAAGGKIHVQFDAPRPKWMSYFLLPLLGYHDLGDTPKSYPPGKYPFGGNMGFRKSIFQQTGLFNTDLGRKGSNLNAAEEKELFLRIRALGRPIYYLPDAFLYHRVDSKRLTKSFVQKQAEGLGRSMKLQMHEASLSGRIKNFIVEAGKTIATVPIAIGYLLILQGAKALLLFKFRWWIWKGYQNAKDNFTT